MCAGLGDNCRNIGNVFEIKIVIFNEHDNDFENLTNEVAEVDIHWLMIVSLPIIRKHSFI